MFLHENGAMRYAAYVHFEASEDAGWKPSISQELNTRSCYTDKQWLIPVWRSWCDLYLSKIFSKLIIRWLTRINYSEWSISYTAYNTPPGVRSFYSKIVFLENPIMTLDAQTVQIIHRNSAWMISSSCESRVRRLLALADETWPKLMSANSTILSSDCHFYNWKY